MVDAPTRMAVSVALCLMASAIIARPATAADTSWHWIWLIPDQQGWQAIEGDVILDFDGRDFNTTLEGHAKNFDPTLRVKGRARGKLVEAIVIQEGTDAGQERYRGELQSW